jgi:hypothetical protein
MHDPTPALLCLGVTELTGATGTSGFLDVALDRGKAN